MKTAANRRAYVYALLLIALWVGSIGAAIGLEYLAEQIYTRADQQTGWLLRIAGPWILLPALIVSFKGADKLNGWKQAIGKGLVLLVGLFFLVAWLILLAYSLM